MWDMQAAATTATSSTTASGSASGCTTHITTATWSSSIASSSAIASAARAMLERILGGYHRRAVSSGVFFGPFSALPDVQMQGMLVLQDLAAAAVAFSYATATNASAASSISAHRAVASFATTSTSSSFALDTTILAAGPSAASRVHEQLCRRHGRCRAMLRLVHQQPSRKLPALQVQELWLL